MIINFGWIGISIIILAFILLNTRWNKLFVPVDFIGSTIMIGHSIIINDWPFIIINSFISIMLFIKFKKGDFK